LEIRSRGRWGRVISIADDLGTWIKALVGGRGVQRRQDKVLSHVRISSARRFGRDSGGKRDPEHSARDLNKAMIAIELAKAGKGSYALAQTKVFDNAISAGQ